MTRTYQWYRYETIHVHGSLFIYFICNWPSLGKNIHTYMCECACIVFTFLFCLHHIYFILLYYNILFMLFTFHIIVKLWYNISYSDIHSWIDHIISNLIVLLFSASFKVDWKAYEQVFFWNPLIPTQTRMTHTK